MLVCTNILNGLHRLFRSTRDQTRSWCDKFFGLWLCPVFFLNYDYIWLTWQSWVIDSRNLNKNHVLCNHSKVTSTALSVECLIGRHFIFLRWLFSKQGLQPHGHLITNLVELWTINHTILTIPWYWLIAKSFDFVVLLDKFAALHVFSTMLANVRLSKLSPPSTSSTSTSVKSKSWKIFNQRTKSLVLCHQSVHYVWIDSLAITWLSTILSDCVTLKSILASVLVFEEEHSVQLQTW